MSTTTGTATHAIFGKNESDLSTQIANIFSRGADRGPAVAVAEDKSKRAGTRSSLLSGPALHPGSPRSSLASRLHAGNHSAQTHSSQASSLASQLSRFFTTSENATVLNNNSNFRPSEVSQPTTGIPSYLASYFPAELDPRVLWSKIATYLSSQHSRWDCFSMLSVDWGGYPMYAMPMEQFLEIGIVEPHQEYLRRGLLQIPSKEDTVYFISHEWMGGSHPDFNGRQIRVMQEGFRNIMDDNLEGPIQEFWNDGYMLNIKTRIKDRKAWVEDMRKALVWYDYLSIPQTSHDPNCGAMQEQAIGSIPDYVSRADCLFVLAPSMTSNEDHANCSFVEEIRDFSTWSSRGWCVIEHFGMSLTVGGCINPNDNAHVIRVNSARDMSFCSQSLLLYSQVGERTFTCCQMKHQVPRSGSGGHIQGQGPPRSGGFDHIASGGSFESAYKTIRCDKVRLFPVVKDMLWKKLQSLADGDAEDVRCYRPLRALIAYYLSGFEDNYEAILYAGGLEQDLQAFLTMYKFKDPHENDQGWTPLRCAALCANLTIVRQLIELDVDVNAPFPIGSPQRHFWGAHQGSNILCHTAIWCHTEKHQQVMSLLYDLGHAKVRQNSIDVLNSAVVRRTAKGHVNHGANWVLEKFPNYNVNMRSVRGIFPLFTLVFYSYNLPLVKRLVEEHGAQVTKKSRLCKWSVLWAACSSDFFGIEIVDYIYKVMMRGRDENGRLRNGHAHEESGVQIKASPSQEDVEGQISLDDEKLVKRFNCANSKGGWNFFKSRSKTSSSSRTPLNALQCGGKELKPWSGWSKVEMSPYVYYLLCLKRCILPVTSSRMRKFLNAYRSTLLHSAVYDGKVNVCQWLLHKQADPNTKDHNGETPIMIARRMELTNLTQLLESYAAAKEEITLNSKLYVNIYSYKGNLISPIRGSVSRLLPKGSKFMIMKPKPDTVEWIREEQRQMQSV